MICAIGLDQQKALATAIHKTLKEKESFNLDELVKEIHAFVLDASQNKDQALAYARLVPKWTGILLQSDTPLRKKLGASLDSINQKADLYEESIDNVVKDIAPAQDPIQKLVEGQKQVDEIVESEMEELAKAKLESTIDEANDRDVLIPSFMSTLAFETGSESFSFDIQKKLLNNLKRSTVTQNGMPVIDYPGAGRLYLRPVKTQSLGENNWRKGSDGILKYTPQEGDVAYALVDSKGEFVYMDPEGNVVDKDKGRIPYWNTYRADNFIRETSDGGIDFHPHVRSENAIKAEYQERQHNSFRKVLNQYSMKKFNKPFDKLSTENQMLIGKNLLKQLEYNYYAEKTALEKPETVLMMNITGGSFGRKIIDKTTRKDQKVALSEIMEPNSLQVRLKKEAKSPQAVFLDPNGRMKVIDISAGVRPSDVDVVMELFFNQDLMIKGKDGKMRPITNQERRDQLEKFMYPGDNADKFDGVRIDKKDLKIGVDSNGQFKIQMKPMKGNLYDLKAPLVDVSAEPNVREMVKAYLGRTAFYDITDKFGDDFSVPSISTVEGKKVLNLKPENYNEWVRKNKKFVADPMAKTAEETKDSFFTYEPTRETVKEIIKQKPSNQLTSTEKAVVSEKPKTVAGKIKEVNDAFQEAKVTDPMAAGVYRQELEDLREQERDERLWQERGFLREGTAPAQVSADKFAKKNIFNVVPQSGAVDLKASIKASIATQYIGFGEGIRGSKGQRSSTEIYREQAGEYANTGNYSANDVIFVSIPGKRGAESKRKEEQDKTIKEAIKALDAGATILTDNKSYIDSSNYNEGEKRLYQNLEAKGYNYSEITVDDQVIGTWTKSAPAQAPVTETGIPKGEEVKSGIYVNQAALTKEEQLELFDYLKPYLESQAAKTNKGKDASKMIGLGLRWDYKSNNPGKTALDVADVINPGNKNKYGYYDRSINDEPLAPISTRFRELMQKATGVDMTHYDGAIINLYEETSFISSHNDVDESRSAIQYPVIGVNLGGTGNFSIESRDGSPKQLDLQPGTGYVFGVNGTNREVFHRTFPTPQDSFLPELTTKLDGKTYPAGSYRVTITMRRVMPLEKGLPVKPAMSTQAPVTSQVKPQVQTAPTVKDSSPAVPTNTKKGFTDFLNNTKFDKLTKQKTGNIKATPEQIEEARKWYESSPLKAHFPFEAVFDAVNQDNPNSVAQWSIDGIKLFKGADYSDLYHEAWHGFSQTFLTPEERKVMYSEMRKKTGDFVDYDGNRVSFAKANDLQLEEYIAEKFREYVLSKGVKVDAATPKTNNIFKRILNFLKELFGFTTKQDPVKGAIMTPMIDQLFEKLRVGNVSAHTFNAANRGFGVLYSTITAVNPQEQTKRQLNYQDTQKIINSVDSVLSEVMDQLNEMQGGGTRRFSSTLFKTNRNKLLAYKAVKMEFERRLGEMKTELDNETDPVKKNSIQYNYDLLQWAVENFGNLDSIQANLPTQTEPGVGVIYAHLQKSRLLSNEDKASAYEKDELSETEQTASGRTAFERSGQDNSLKDLASKEVLYLLRGLYKYDKNGKPELNELGFNKLVESDKIFNYLAKELQGTVDAELMYSKLEALSRRTSDPAMANTVARLLDKLGSYDETAGGIAQNYEDNHLFTNFWQTFNPTVVPLVQMTVTETRDGESNISYKVTVGEASSSSMSVLREWENRFNIETTNYIREEQIDVKKQRFAETKNYLDVPALLKDFPTLNSTGAVGEMNGNKMFDFLSAVGIKLTYSSEIINQLANNPQLQKAVSVMYSDIVASVEENRPINSIKELYRSENQNRITDFKELESKLGLGGSSKFMVTNAEGNTQFEHSLNSTMSVMVEAINRVKSFQELIAMPHMAHLDPKRNPFTKSSIWLRSIFNVDENGNFTTKRLGLDLKPIVLHLNNLSGVKSINEFGGEEGVATASSDPATKLILDFHSMMMLGRPENPRHADKSSSYTMYVDLVNEPGRKNKRNGHKYIDDVEFFLNPNKTFNNNGFGKVFDLNGSMAREQVLAYVIPYVKSELKRIETMKALQEKGITNYDFEYMKNGQKFVLFDDVFDTKLKKDLIQAGTDNFEALEERVKDQVTDYFNRMILDVQKMEAKSSFRDEAIATRIRKELKAEGLKGGLAAKDINLGSIASFAVNSWLHNLEAVTMMYGDLALYNHKKEEFHKRNAGIASTGLLFRSDASALKFAQSLGRKYAQKNKLKQKDLAQDGTYDSAVFEDSLPASKYFPDYEKLITKHFNDLYPKDPAKATLKIAKALKPYREGNIEEGNAQGWVTFDFYRIMLTLEGKWSSEQEDLYNKIINGNTEVDIEQVMQFFPIKKVQYWGYVKTAEGPPVLAMHKFSLMPLVPNVIKDTNLEKLHHRMINEEIDYALFKTGSKVGTVTQNETADRFYSDQAKRTFDESGRLTKNTAFFNYLKDQLETGDSFKEKVTSPSQMRKLLIDGFVEQGVPKDFIAQAKAKGLSMDQIRKNWDKLDEQKKREVSKDYVKYKTYEERVEALTRDKYQKLLKKIDFQEVDGKPTGNIDKLVRYIQKQFDAQDLSQHEKEFIAAAEGNKGLKNDLSLSLSADKIEKVLNAIVVRELVKQKVKGEGLVQVSSAGFEKVGEDSSLGFYEIVKDKDGNDTVKAAEIKIALQGDFVMLLDLPEVKSRAEKEGVTTLEALNFFINDQEWLSKKDNQKMLMVTAARIPVQGRNSMEFFKIQEFLPPNAGNMIVVPSEIVSKAGSDFDIDKLFTMMPTLMKDEKTGRVFYDKKSKENLVMESQIDILSDPTEFVNLIRPNATDIFDDLQAELKDDVSEYNPKDSYNADPERVNDKGEPIISATRIFEMPYNIYKQNTNSVGKAVLGIGAVDNTYNVLFNRIGMHMNLTSMGITLDDYMAIREELDSYSGTRAPKNITYQDSTGKNVTLNTKKARGMVKEFAYQTLRLPHNTMNVNGEDVISLSDTFDAQGDNRISDVINQMINGWVDVAKDPWIFNIQGNKEISPTLLFLVQSGVPIKDAVYFVSQPLVREYIEMQRGKKGTFAGPLGRKPSKPTLSAYEAEREILVNVIGVGTYATKGGVWIDRASQFDASQQLNRGFNKDNPYSPDVMRERIKTYNETKKNDEQYEYTNFDKASFLHFLEVEKMAKAVKEIKVNTNVDTERQTTLFEARAKERAIRQVGKTQRIPAEMVTKLQEQTAISSFFEVLKWQQKMWGPLFKMRDNKLMNTTLDNILELPIASDMVEATFGSEERFANEFRNDFPVYLFQKNLYRFDLGSVMSKGYRGYRSSEMTPAVPLEVLDFGVYFKDGVVYVDRKQLEKDWENLDTLSKEYNVANVTKSMFDTKEQYYKFVFEREYLRSQYPFERMNQVFLYQQRFEVNRASYNESTPDNQIARITYEEVLKNMALENSYNIAHMFTGKNTMVDKLTQIQKSEEFKELKENYDVLKVLGVKKSGKFWNIKLLDRLLESDDVEKYHQNLKELSNPNTIRVNTSYENKIILADFFKKLDVYSILQSGMNTNTELSLQRIVDQDTFLRYMQPISDSFLRNIDSKEAKAEMADFANKFAFTVNKSSVRGKVKNYMKTTTRNVFTADEYFEEAEEETKSTLLSEDVNGRTVYDLSKATEETARKMVSENPDVLFVFNDTVTEPSTKPTKKNGPLGHYLKVLAKEFNNVIGIPSRLNYSDQFGSAAIKDVTSGQQPGKLTGKTVKVISEADVQAYKAYLATSKGVQPKEFFTQATKFKEFYNPETGKREKAPQSSKWLLQSNGLYNLTDKESGEIYITNVDLGTGMKPLEEGASPIPSIRADVKEKVDRVTAAISEWTKTPGRTVAFAKQGYGQILLNANDLTGTIIRKQTSSVETFKYISESLAKVGYVNVNYAEKIGDARAKLAEGQPVTDQDVYDQLKFCFGL